jgi:selenocysteine lyase/cysteine desulfurase
MSDVTRRGVLGGVVATGVAPAAAQAATSTRDPGDDAYWRSIAANYDVTEDVVQLENGNWGVMARPVLEAHERHLRMINQQGSFYARRQYSKALGAIRQRVAVTLGVAAEEIAFTRGATEALQALIGGYNRLRAGDQVLCADLDYDSMQTAMGWLKARRGAELVKIALPEPATHQGLIDAYARALDLNPRVRMMLVTHVSHRTGLVLPVGEIVEMARARGVDCIVDSAHAWGQLDFSLPDIKADFVGLNAHKWIGAPLGVGILYCRRARIGDIDPYMGEEEARGGDVNARVHTGTSNCAAYLSVPDALDFHDLIGIAAKAARLRRLRDRWAEALRDNAAFEILTPPDPRLASAITSFRLHAKTSVADNIAIARALLERHRIFTVHRVGVAAGACVRVTPGVFSSDDDIDRLLLALRTMAKA